MTLLDNARTYLNQKTDYLINWNRAGSLFFSNHRYSNRELIERGFVLASTAMGGFLAWNKSEEGGATPFALGASLAFLLAHTVTMSPLIYKRLQAKWSCNEQIHNIHNQLGDTDKYVAALVEQAITQIMTHAADKSPSAVWGKRSRLLKTLATWIAEEDPQQLSKVLEQDELISLLNEGNFPQTTSLRLN